MVVAGLVLLLACRSLGAVQPVVLFLLKLALIGALEVFTWLGHLQIQHDALPFSSEQSPDTGAIASAMIVGRQMLSLASGSEFRQATPNESVPS